MFSLRFEPCRIDEMRSGRGKVTTEYIGTSLGSGFWANQARRTAGRRLATPPPSPLSQAAPGKCCSRSAWYCSAALASGDPGADLGVVDDRLEDVGRALRVADQDQARRGGFGIPGHDPVADLARVD